MRRYTLSPEAQQDLQDIRAYYLKEAGARVTRHVAKEINAAFAFLTATPGAGHSRVDLTDEPLKFWAVFSFLIVYDPATQPLGIARVLHGSRDIAAVLSRKPGP